MPCKRMSSDKSNPNYNKWYCYFYYTNSQGKKVKKKKEGFLSKKEAIEYENNFIVDYKGESEMTFKKLCKEYMEHAKLNVRKTTYSGKEYIITQKVLPYFSEMRVSEITANDVRLWQNSIISSEKAYKAGYLKSINSQLVAILNFAIKFYDLANNAARLCGSMGSNKSAEEMFFWTEKEFNIFIKQVENKPISKILFNLLFYTGMRIGETLALTLNDFNFENNYLTVNKSYTRFKGKDLLHEPKTQKSNRKIYLPPFLLKLVKEYSEQLYDYKPDERLVTVTKFYLAHEMKRGVKGIDLNRIRIHDFRHSHVAHLIELGESIYVISERLGHENIKTTLDTYAHLYPNKQEDIASKLEKKYMEERNKSN